MRLVLIEWVDSFGCSPNWTPMSEDQPEPMICKSVGWLAHDGTSCKVVVPHIADSAEQGCGDMTIPNEAIRRVVDLEAPPG